MSSVRVGHYIVPTRVMLSARVCHIDNLSAALTKIPDVDEAIVLNEHSDSNRPGQTDPDGQIEGLDGLNAQHWPDSTLYVVATPIGNRFDISMRAVEVLKRVDLIAAEDTRHSGALTRQLAIETPMIACHDHNESDAAQRVLALLGDGQSVALVSDAGTPLISDPGYQLVKQVREQGFRVTPIPGACALISALSASGLPTDRFAFEGFLPARREARQKRLQQLAAMSGTMVFYEAPHRIVDSLNAMATVFGGHRQAVLARELTKRYETIIDAPLEQLANQVAEDRNQQRGEMVIMVSGAAAVAEDHDETQREADRVLTALLEAVPAKTAAQVAVKLTGLKKNFLYQRAIALQEQSAQRSDST